MTARTGRHTGRHGSIKLRDVARDGKVQMRLNAHDIASALPAAIQGIVQKGLLQRVFRDALTPEWIFPTIADTEPWVGNIGDEKIWTRKGLMTPTPTPITPGSDVTAASYSLEQWTATLDQWGRSIDTNMLASAVALGSKYVEDVEQLGVHAAQSMSQAARNALWAPYSGGRTHVTAGATSTTIAVANTQGFGFTSVNGRLTAVSAGNPLTVTVNGVANTVTGTSTASGPGTLTLGTSVTVTNGQAVIAANAPQVVQPTGTNAYDLGANNIATLTLFRAAATRLAKMNVPRINGGYTAFVTEDTINELWLDPDWKQATQGLAESPVWRERSFGRVNGIDFVVNNETPMTLGGSGGTLPVNNCLMVGGGALVWSPLQGLAELLRGTGVESVPSISMVQPSPGVEVALIVRPPQDRLQQQVSTSWTTVGGFGVPTDLLNASGDTSLYKRAVLIRHA
ncbi:hypothetical protein JCM9957A_49480 [Kineosporia succinea]